MIPLTPPASKASQAHRQLRKMNSKGLIVWGCDYCKESWIENSNGDAPACAPRPKRHQVRILRENGKPSAYHCYLCKETWLIGNESPRLCIPDTPREPEKTRPKPFLGSAASYDFSQVEMNVVGGSGGVSCNSNSPTPSYAYDPGGRPYVPSSHKPPIDHSQIRDRDRYEPTPSDLQHPIFNALWSVMRWMDVLHPGGLLSGATGNDVMIVLNQHGITMSSESRIRRNRKLDQISSYLKHTQDLVEKAKEKV